MYEDIIEMLANAAGIIEDARAELESTQPIIHKDLIEFEWISIAECTPAHNEKVIVRTKDGCMYFLSYPFDHAKHPYWWPMPAIPENEP